MSQSIRILDTGYIYRNPKPHLVSRHAYFPSLCALPDGSIVAGFDLGSAFEAIDVRSFTARSTDGGATWSAPVQVFEPDTSQHAVSTSCRLAHVGGGRVVGLAALMDRSRRDEGLANPETEGFVRTEFALVSSTDGGRSFSAPAPVAPPVDWAAFEICSPVFPTRQPNRWLIPTAPWPDWSGHNPFGPKAVAFLSDDGGQSWSRCVDVMNRRAERIAFYEQKLATISDRRILALCWTMDLTTQRNLPNYFALSTDDGESFGPPTPTPLAGETCTPLALPDNHLLCVYRRVDDRKGLWAHLARIEGNAWRPLLDVPLWGVNVAARDTHQQSLLAQMSTLRFGCPTLVCPSAGEALVVFWGVEDGVSSIRWLRLSVSL